MDIDMPLVLSWAVLITGGIWAFDALLLKRKRQSAADALTASGSSEAAIGEAETANTAFAAEAEEMQRAAIAEALEKRQ